MAVDKDYVDAQNEKTRAQNDARFAEVLAGVGRIGDQIAAQSTINTERFNSLSHEVALTRDAANRAEASAASVKWNILMASVGVVAVLVAVFAAWMQGIDLVAGIMKQP